MQFEPKLFNPRSDPTRSFAASDDAVGFSIGAAPEDCYIYSPAVVLAINVAMATRRPLLVSGEPGSGKSLLARNAAGVLGRAYYEQVITSRTQASDLLWRFDALARLRDAKAGESGGAREDYVEPGRVWWAFDPDGAARRGAKTFKDPAAPAPAGAGAVLLLDEIDKADPDVPNDLLEPFGARKFTVRETGETVVVKRDVLLFFTTNRERELPQAFLRRCVVLAMPEPSAAWFVELAKYKYPTLETSLFDAVAEKFMGLRRAARQSGQRPPGAAEFLDAIEACKALGVDARSEAFEAFMLAVAWKQPERPPQPQRAEP